jgi:hypothetical protein
MNRRNQKGKEKKRKILVVSLYLIWKIITDMGVLANYESTDDALLTAQI